ncbi:unnamed protein product [Camellia sinensis]
MVHGWCCLSTPSEEREATSKAMASSSNLSSFLLFLLSLFSLSTDLALGHESSRGRREEEVGIRGRRVLMGFKETPSGGNVTFDCSPSGPCVACLYSEKYGCMLHIKLTMAFNKLVIVVSLPSPDPALAGVSCMGLPLFCLTFLLLDASRAHECQCGEVEKNDEKYRCSETGYRIPLKCVKIEAGTNQVNSKKAQPNRSTLENNSAKEKLHVMLHNAEESYTSIRQRSLLADSSTSVGGSQPYITYRSCIPPINEEKLSVIGFEGIILGLLLISSSLIYFRRKQSSVAAGVGAMRIPTNSRF